MAMASYCSWPVGPASPSLSNSEVHIWCARLVQPPSRIDDLATLLSPDERDRAGRFKFQELRRKFIIGRGTLRLLLSRYLSSPPELLRFSYSPQGKPALQARPDLPQLHFNLAHSEKLALYAICRNQPLGVDVEAVRIFDSMAQIAKRFFSPAENAAFESTPLDGRTAAFFNCWTRKEAFIKATGEGLSRPLDQFEVTLKPDQPARVVQIEGRPKAAAEWTLAALAPAPGYVGALAIWGQSWQLSQWCWTDY